ncbi:N-acyl homoserine lactonase family protein [soil metagenome]
MTPTYEIIVRGNNLRLKDDFLGMSSISLIHGASGPILFDTGGYVSRVGLLKQLRQRNLAPSDIKRVFLSHLHFDHSHNIDLFPQARVFVSKREWEYAADPHPDDIMMPWGIREQLSKGDVELLEGEGFIDDGISYFPAPGHTPGCYALEFQTADKGRVVIAGDAIKYIKEVILGRCDMAFDTIEAGTASIQCILARADRIVPGHFPELIRQPSGSFSWEEDASFHLLVR